ncbi:MAG: IS66 family transposase [Chloroflexia bacterium]|nr:IS66 family transposase [Chloroflexia bacterium]
MLLAVAMQEEDKKHISEIFARVLIELEELKKENAALKLEISELQARLKSNSRNSSKPPSSDGYTKKPAFPKQSKGKKGGQKGHKGKTLQQIPNPDEIIKCLPTQCKCGHNLSNNRSDLSEKRQVFELPKTKLSVTEYQIHKTQCPKCGAENKGKVPEGVNSPAQYGNHAKAFAVLLNTHYKLPFKKIQLLFNDLFGYSINESTIYTASKTCYDKLEKTEEIIKSRVASQKVAHADESGIRVNGSLHWLHVATSTLYTYLFVHEKRGKEALDSDKSILSDFKNWLVHDCWSSYFKYNGFNHAICGAHILRELEALVESGNSKWAKTFKTFLLDIYSQPFENRMTRKAITDSRYSRICQIGERLEPPPIKIKGKKGRYKRTKGRNLVERLMREKEAVLAFTFDKDVPFTNNLAERDIRPVKVKMKVSNCFRTFEGAEIYSRIESFASTARKQNRNIFQELCNTLNGNNFLTSPTPC